MHRRLIRLAILPCIALVAIALWAAGLTVTFGGSVAALLTVVAGIGAGHIYERRSVPMDRLVTAIECSSMLVLITMLGGLASYAAAAASHGYVDGSLAAADNMLKLDWMAYWTFFQSRPALYGVLDGGYLSVFWFPTLMIIALAFTGAEQRIYLFLVAFGIALAVTDIIFIFAPARSAVLFYLGSSPDLPAMPHAAVIEALRTGDLKSVSLGNIEGLITFPSFHTVCGLLFIWASWSNVWLRIVSLLVNLDLLISTPVCGSHYFIDMIGGALVTVMSIRIALWVGSPAAISLLSWTRARTAQRQWPPASIVPLD